MHGQELLQQPKGKPSPQASLADGADAPPLILVAQDLSPADMLQFKRSVFAGFVTSVGGKTSHTAIVAAQHGYSCRGGRAGRPAS